MIPLLFLCCLSGVSLGFEVLQSPDLITDSGGQVQIFCSHEKTDFRMMLWYQKSPGDTTMKLIGYLNYKASTMETQYKDLFTIDGDLGGDGTKNGSLHIRDVRLDHSAVYYCAASKAH